MLNRIFSLLTIATALILILPRLLADGMFMDGLIYATLGHNLAEGRGSFWYPHFSQGLFPSFHEHPPLGFGIQALFFQLFGSSIYVERFFSLFTAMVSAFLMVRLWKKAGGEAAYWWLPVLFWVITPLVHWSYACNMLENTLSVFTLGAILCYWIFKEKNSLFYLVLGSLLIIGGLLTKGFPALFPLAFFFLDWLINRDLSFIKMALVSIAGTVIVIGGVCLMLWLIPDAFDSLSIYFKTQFMESLKGERVVKSRLHILGVLFRQLLPMLIAFLAFWGSIRIFNKSFFADNWVNKQAWLMLLIGASASLPIMVSPKQLGFYIVPSVPYFALGIALFCAPVLKHWISRISLEESRFKPFLSFAWLVVFLALLLGIRGLTRTNRDARMLDDVYAIGARLPEGTVLSLHEELYKEYGLMGYFARYFYISLDREDKDHDYFLVPKSVEVDAKYELMPWNLDVYKIYKKRNAGH